MCGVWWGCVRLFFEGVREHSLTRYTDALLNLDPGGSLATSDEGRRVNAHFACISLGTWLGIHALRTYVTMAVWSLGDVLPVALKGVPPALIFFIGLFAWPARKAFGGARPAFRFAIALAVLAILRQSSLTSASLAIGFSFAAWIVWMWWLPAAIESAAADNALSVIAPAAMCGVALQVALQSALHGLDLPLWPAWQNIAVAAAIAMAFAYANQLAHRDRTIADEQLSAGAARGLIAYGPWFFLQLTLLASLGRIAQAMGWSQTAAAAFLTASLLLGAAATLFAPGVRVRWALGIFAVLWLPVLYRAGSLALWLVPPAQITLALLLAAAFTANDTALKRLSAYTGATIGMLLFFAFLFVFYTFYEVPVLWPLAIAVVMTMGVTTARAQPHRHRLQLYATGALITLGVAASALHKPTPAKLDAAPANLRVMSFNVHQGYDYLGRPSLPRIARTIEQAEPDLAGLQEVDRGWDILGGNDVIGWLRWRLPMYDVTYGPTHRQMWGNAILSRYSVVARGSGPFVTQAASFHYGFAWVRINTAAGTTLFVTAHLAPHLTGGTPESRAAQANELLGIWGRKSRTMITGDFNSDPDDPAIHQTAASGLLDAGSSIAPGKAHTSPVDAPRHRIDYVFVAPDVALLGAFVLPSLASDHLSVVANVRLR